MPSRPSKTKPQVPWQHASDLAMLRDWFYPQHVPFDPYSPPATLNDMRVEAIDHVKAWEWKGEQIPHSIASTAELTEALFHYERFSRALAADSDDKGLEQVESINHPKRSELSTTAIQLMLSMAFMRFVNGFVDRDIVKSTSKKAGLAINRTSDSGDEEQDRDQSLTQIPKGVGDSSMYAHAVTIGMPSTFIDFRHRVAHGAMMPPVKELVDMHLKALEWLWDRWWKVNAKGDPGRALWERQERLKASVNVVHEDADKGRKRKRDGADITNMSNEDGSDISEQQEGIQGWIPA